MVEIATLLQTGHRQGGAPLMMRRDQLSPAFGLGLASLMSVVLWVILLNLARWVASGIF